MITKLCLSAVGALALVLVVSTLVAHERRPASVSDSRYPISVSTEGHDWDFPREVALFKDRIPAEALEYFKALREEDLLRKPQGVTYSQEVSPGSGTAPVKAAVELCKVLLPVPYARLVEQFPPALWGERLAHRLGGEIRVLEADAEGRPLRQLERMVLSALPGDRSWFWLDQDMTKLEQITYGTDRASVAWKVVFSDNGSTAMDLGRLEFEASGEARTLVTFHSAHRLTLLGAPLAANLVGPSIRKAFLDHLEVYVDRAR